MPAIMPSRRPTGVIDDQRVGNYGVHCALGTGALALSHPVADHLAAAKLDLFTIGGQVALHLND
jgi:hypothetical protein